VVHVWVRVKPRSSKNRILGWAPDGFLEVQVKAIPERGEANRACRKELASALGLTRDRVILDKGQTSRLKKFCIQGVSDEHVRMRLSREIGKKADQ
jgi:uncharacterized protein YggU (UPF0235/DUF167 family)